MKESAEKRNRHPPAVIIFSAEAYCNRVRRPHVPSRFQPAPHTLCGRSQYFSGGHGRHVVRHAIRKHEPPVLHDEMELVDHSPVRIGSAHERTGFLVRTEDNKGLMPIPGPIGLAIGGCHPKTQKAPACLPTSDHFFPDGSLFLRQLHRAFEMPQQKPDVFERRTGFFRFTNGVEPKGLRRSGIDEQGLCLSRPLYKTQDSLPLPAVCELGKQFTPVTDTQQCQRRLLAGPLASRW
jgi:hypothetical protein